MSICLCHQSADQALESLAQEKHLTEPASTAIIERLTSGRDEVLSACRGMQPITLPVNVLIGDSAHTRSDGYVKTHMWKGDLPDGSIKRISDGVYVASPELCLVQQASEISFVRLCQMLGRYLGTFSPSKGSDFGFVERQALTTEEELSGFIRKLPVKRPAGIVRQAMRWTCPFSASPQEVNLQLALSLPPTCHGFALPCPHMNYEVELEDTAKEFCKPDKSIRIDLCWPDFGIGLEYQGEYHQSQIGKDYARNLAANYMGYQLWYLANEQMVDAVQLEYIARIIARRVRKKINPKTWPTTDEVQKLLDVLSGASDDTLNKRWRVRKKKDHRGR